MDFSFNDTQQDVQKLTRQILSELSTPDRLNQIDQQVDRFDESLWQQLATSGLLGVAIDERYGGMGFGFTELCLLIEEVGRTVAALPVIPVLVSAALPIQKYGSNEQKERLLTGLVKGETFITAALSEAMSEFPGAPEVMAVVTESDYLLTGTKIAVPFADKAECILITADTVDGIGLFLVNPKAKGVVLTRQRSTTNEPWFELTMNDVSVAAEDVLVTGSEAVEVADWISERTMAASCVMQVGVVDEMTRMTASYTCERVQFNAPIGSFQAVQHRAADCLIDSTCLKLTAYQAVSLLDEDSEATAEVLIAKIWAGDAGHRVSYAAQHLHGGMGIDKDYHLWRYCLWARQLEMSLGNSASHLSALGERIARE
ncbi:acyl-CoA dehydrogenase [Endozoicomonas sp. OPT23]|uniref:acyl-CoA dehydrogenase family protein n=1 Tax=Endozoicomonas sp. OPT23 TaxID=2072845 RepID=UPI00129A5247|nr:acyl-CoA dehydrogenase family protein [Endozoicomonas sp. OPT23]MRI33986.1 acyl-CoA dehydrogenase [Endozoicomonas sp. OPT23]